jgi:hypothetical protein
MGTFLLIFLKEGISRNACKKCAGMIDFGHHSISVVMIPPKLITWAFFFKFIYIFVGVSVGRTISANGFLSAHDTPINFFDQLVF